MTSAVPVTADESPLGLPSTWPLVRCHARSKHYLKDAQQKTQKKPVPLTPIPRHSLAKRYLDGGANLGLLTGKRSGIDIIDVDDRELFDDMVAALGQLTIFAESGGGGGRVHCYAVYTGLKTQVIWWKGKKVGHLLSDKAFALIAPSVHPKTGRKYRWLVQPLVTAIPELPDTWKAYLAAQPENQPKKKMSRSDSSSPIVLPTDEYARRRAVAIDEFGGSERSASGNIKFGCPACGDADKHDDNAVLFPNGIVACWTKIPEHHAELRRSFGITASTRLDADPFVQAQITQWLVELMRPPFTTALSNTLTAMAFAHATIVYRIGRLEYPGSEREVAELGGIGHRTVRKNNPKFIRTGIVSRIFRGRRGPKNKPTRWHFNLPPTYHLKESDQVSVTPQLVPGRELREVTLQEKTEALRTPAVDWPLILAHDVFRNRIGLGKGCGRVYLYLLLAGPTGMTIGIFGAAKKKTVARQLDRLRFYGLASRQAHRWTVGAVSLDQAVKRFPRAIARLERQQEEHAADRAVWFDRTRTIVRFPTSAKRPRRTTSPLPPSLQDVVDHLRAHRPQRRRR